MDRLIQIPPTTTSENITHTEQSREHWIWDRSMETAQRKTKWRTVPPPPPSPKILHFPLRRRTRRKTAKPTVHYQHHNSPVSSHMHTRCLLNRGNLESLFDQEFDDSPMKHVGSTEISVGERRERVEKWRESSGGGGLEEERWRFQAEMLRAECNFLRMERELALRKLESNRVKMERTLRSAVQTLIAGRKKIFEGKNANAVLEEEIEDLTEKLQELQNSSINNEYQVPNTTNFDKKACILRRRLEKLGGLSGETCSDRFQELSDSKLSIRTRCSVDRESSISNCKTDNKFIHNVQEKMDELSHGMLDRFQEEYSSVISSRANSSPSTSMRIDYADYSSFSNRQLFQEPLPQETKCSGRCKALVRQIVEQVRAETEQWSQMQHMLAKVRGEMEQLQSSRDFWENRAHDSDQELECLKLVVEQWRQKALAFENQVQELQLQLSLLREDNLESGIVIRDFPLAPSRKQVEREKFLLSDQVKQRKACNFETALDKLKMDKNMENKDLPTISLRKHLAKEKRLMLSGSKENSLVGDNGGTRELSENARKSNCPKNSGVVALKRSPLKDIRNASLLTR